MPTKEAVEAVRAGTLFVEKTRNGVQILHDTVNDKHIGKELNGWFESNKYRNIKTQEQANLKNDNDYADPIESMEAFVNGTDDERAAMTKEFREHTKKRQMERDKQNLKYAGKVLESGDSIIVINEHVGEIYVDSGNVGKSGNGLQHMIEQRFEKDGKSVDEISALLGLVIDSASNGTIARDTKVVQNNQDIGTYDLEKNGIIAFVSKTRDGKDEKFVITGFDDFSKKEQATDAIKTVIANNSYDSDFVIVKNQTVAVLASAYNLHLQELNVNIEKAKNATNIGTKKQFIDKVEKLEKLIEKYNSNDDIKEAIQKVNEKDNNYNNSIENIEAFVNGTDDERAAMTKEFRERNFAKDKNLFAELKDTLSEGTVFIGKNKTLGDIQIRRGNKHTGLVHIIERRYAERVLNQKVLMDPEQAKKEITAISFLVADSLEKQEAIKQANGNWKIDDNGIEAIISKDAKGRFVLTGYDDNRQKKEATESINAVIAKYGNTPDFLGVYGQVGAVIASLQQNIPQEQNSVNEKYNKCLVRWKISLCETVNDRNVATNIFSLLKS